MERLGTRTVDELGRVVMPREVRLLKGWKLGDKITFCNYNGVIVIETSDLAQEPVQMPEQAPME